MIHTGGGPNDVFLALISASSATPLIGIVSPGLKHCNKNVVQLPH